VLTLYPDLTVPGVFDDPDVRELMGVNEHDGALWIHKESAEDLIYRFFLSSLPDIAPGYFETGVIERFQTAERLGAAIERSGYSMERFVEDITAQRSTKG